MIVHFTLCTLQSAHYIVYTLLFVLRWVHVPRVNNKHCRYSRKLDTPLEGFRSRILWHMYRKPAFHLDTEGLDGEQFVVHHLKKRDARCQVSRKVAVKR